MSDSYFCLMETKGHTKIIKQSISYPNLPSAILLVPHSELYPVLVFIEQSSLQGVPFQVNRETPDNNIELSVTEIQIDNQFDVGTQSSFMPSKSDF